MFVIARVLFRLSPLLALAGLMTLSTPAAAQVGMVCKLPDALQAGDPTRPIFHLQATDGYVQTPEGNVLYMWGYAPHGGTFQMPGPVLCVNEGDTVFVRLENNLCSTSATCVPEPVSIVFPGQRNVRAVDVTVGPAPPATQGLLALQAEPGGGGRVRYYFNATHPGTYLYESGTMRHKQVQMGLYGAIVVRPALGPSYAYNDADTIFSDEFLMLLHEIDPVLHKAVELGQPFDQTTRHDRYWTINGRSMPDVLLDNGFPLLPTQPYGALVQVQAIDTGDLVADPDPILVRYANGGTVNHPFHPHGDHLKIIAQDARLLGDAEREAFTKTIAAGQTNDLLFTWENVEAWQTNVEAGAGPLPVEVPGLLNLVFKDDVTFYSGDPHLGFQDAMPPAVTTFNECGEFYFPWHSHALHNVQNFDEGFGGMLTMVRVDPPGGCP